MFMRATCVFGIVMCCAAFGVCFPQTPPPSGKQPSSPAKRTESFWHKVLRVSGIAQSPSTLRGPGDEVQHGQIWIGDLAAGQPRKLTTAGGFRSPVFLPEGNDILALKGTDLVRVASVSGKVTNLFAVAGLTKLVGFTEDDPDKVLVLSRDSSGAPAVAFLSVATGKLDPLPYDPSSIEDRRLVEYLSAWDRRYGDTILYIDQQTKASMAGTLSWTDAFLKKGSSAVKNVSNCNGTNCGQPSLSPDGKLVAFVRSDED
jgi:hypothetical protein